MENKILFLLMKIRHYKTRIYLSDLWTDLCEMVEMWKHMRNGRKFRRRHETNMKTGKCKCGHDYGTNGGYLRDKDIDIHLDNARNEEEWEKYNK